MKSLFIRPYTATFARFVTLLLVLFISLSPVWAEDAATGQDSVEANVAAATPHEEIILDLKDLPPQESAHYAFLYGYQAILEQKCDGAFLVFTGNNDYIGGYLTPKAPDDFCVRISPDTITVSEPVTRETALAMYSLLGDRMSMSNLMACEEPALIAVIMFRPEEGMVITPLWYAQSEKRLEEAAIAQGMNPEDMYAIMLELGYDKDSLVASVEAGVDPTDITQDAMKYKKDSQTEKESSLSLERRSNIVKGVLMLEGCFLLFLLIYFVGRLFDRKHIDENQEDDQ